MVAAAAVGVLPAAAVEPVAGVGAAPAMERGVWQERADEYLEEYLEARNEFAHERLESERLAQRLSEECNFNKTLQTAAQVRSERTETLETETAQLRSSAMQERKRHYKHSNAVLINELEAREEELLASQSNLAAREEELLASQSNLVVMTEEKKAEECESGINNRVVAICCEETNSKSTPPSNCFSHGDHQTSHAFRCASSSASPQGRSLRASEPQHQIIHLLLSFQAPPPDDSDSEDSPPRAQASS